MNSDKDKSYWLNCPYCGHPFDWDEICDQLPTNALQENVNVFDVTCPECEKKFEVETDLELKYYPREDY